MVSRVGSNQFSKRMRLQANRFPVTASRIVKDAARAGLEAMILGSPIDTSKLVSNWLVTRDGPSSEVIPPYSPGRKGSTGPISVAAALAFGRAEIEDFDVRRDIDLFITNNTPYLRYQQGSQLTALGQAAARAAIAGAKLF